MNYSQSWLLAAVMASAVCISVSSSAAEVAPVNEEFQRLRSTYDKEIQKINDSDLTIIVSEQEKYLAAIVAIQKRMQSGGQLEPLLVITGEVDRFKASKKIDPEDVSRELPEIVPLQNAFIKAVANLPVEKARKVIAMSQSYEKALTTLQETLTKKNDIRGAVDVKNERDALATSHDLVSAKAMLAEIEAKAAAEKLADKKPDKAPEVEPVAVKAEVKKEPVPKKKFSGSPEKRIRQRFEELSKCILKQEYNRVVDFVSPDDVKDIGEEGVRKCFMYLFPFVKMADDPHRKLSVDSVKLGENAESAILVPRLWAGNQWHELPASNWSESDGDWYVDLSKVEEIRQTAEARQNMRESRESLKGEGPRPGGRPLRRLR